MPTAYNAFRTAVLALCDDGDLAVRLERAHAALRGIDASDHLPEFLRFRFQELADDIAYGADSVSEALARMSRGDQERLVARIVSMYGEVARALPAEG